MKVTRLHNTPLSIVVFATRTAYLSYAKGDTHLLSDVLGEKDLELIKSVALNPKKKT